MNVLTLTTDDALYLNQYYKKDIRVENYIIV